MPSRGHRDAFAFGRPDERQEFGKRQPTRSRLSRHELLHRSGGAAQRQHNGCWCGRHRRHPDVVCPSSRRDTVATRHNARVRVKRSRENVFTLTATGQELSALVAAARMALEAMRAAPQPPPAEAVEILDRVIRDFDSARARLASAPPSPDEGGTGKPHAG